MNADFIPEFHTVLKFFSVFFRDRIHGWIRRSYYALPVYALIHPDLAFWEGCFQDLESSLSVYFIIQSILNIRPTIKFNLCISQTFYCIKLCNTKGMSAFICFFSKLLRFDFLL